MTSWNGKWSSKLFSPAQMRSNMCDDRVFTEVIKLLANSICILCSGLSDAYHGMICDKTVPRLSSLSWRELDEAW